MNDEMIRHVNMDGSADCEEFPKILGEVIFGELIDIDLLLCSRFVSPGIPVKMTTVFFQCVSYVPTPCFQYYVDLFSKSNS